VGLQCMQQRQQRRSAWAFRLSAGTPSSLLTFRRVLGLLGVHFKLLAADLFCCTRWRGGGGGVCGAV